MDILAQPRIILNGHSSCRAQLSPHHQCSPQCGVSRQVYTKPPFLLLPYLALPATPPRNWFQEQFQLSLLKNTKLFLHAFLLLLSGESKHWHPFSLEVCVFLVDLYGFLYIRSINVYPIYYKKISATLWYLIFVSVCFFDIQTFLMLKLSSLSLLLFSCFKKFLYDFIFNSWNHWEYMWDKDVSREWKKMCPNESNIEALFY